VGKRIGNGRDFFALLDLRIYYSCFVQQAVKTTKKVTMYQDDNSFWGMHDNHWGAMGIWFFWITIIIITALILYYLMRSTQGRRFSQSKESPLDILRRRYASGEITSQEFEERKGILEKK
tara:strand:- start:115 stop:474 length:360 start_codon:yes stop_codon:yes gene_type:complete